MRPRRSEDFGGWLGNTPVCSLHQHTGQESLHLVGLPAEEENAQLVRRTYLLLQDIELLSSDSEVEFAIIVDFVFL